MDADKKRKWEEAYKEADIASALPAEVLLKNEHLLPMDGGDALDLACGRAGNAQFLAKKGFRVDAMDSSKIVLEHLTQFVKAQNLLIHPRLRDVEEEGLPDKKYDVIVVSYFLYRDLFPEIIKSLKPNGILYYQTWAQPAKGLNTVAGPKSLKFRLQDGELLSLCSPLKTLFYSENQSQGNVQQGLRNEAMIVAQKPV